MRQKNPPAGGGRASVSHRGDDDGTLTANASEAQRELPKPSRQARWQAANPKARWAHIALASGLRRNLLQRQPCAVCGAEPTDGHHPDYDRPLVVIWLCRRCHAAEHRKSGGRRG